MNALSPKDDSFPSKLCGNPLAWRLAARSMPCFRECPVSDDDRRGDVAVKDTAAIADMHPLSECLLGDLAAIGAFLACAARVRLKNDTPGTCYLVGRKRDELPPRGIVDVLGEHAGCQAFDVEIFESDVREAASDTGADLMRMVAPSCSDISMEPSKRTSGLLPLSREALLSGKRSVQAPKPLLVRLGKTGSVDRLAGAKRGKAGQTDVDTDVISRTLTAAIHLDIKNDIPLAEISCQDRAFWHARQAAMPLDLDLAEDSGDAETSALANREAITDTEIGGVETTGSAEPWKSRLLATLHAGKESIKRPLKAPKHLLLGTERPAGKVGLSKAASFQFASLIKVAKTFASTLPRLDALLEGSVVQVREVSQHLVQSRFLRSAREQSVLVGKDLRMYAWRCHGASSTVAGRGVLTHRLADYSPHISRKINSYLGRAVYCAIA